MAFSILGIRFKNSKDEQFLSIENNDLSLNLYEILNNKHNVNENTNITCQDLMITDNADGINFDKVDKAISESSSSEDGEYELYSKIETHMSISSSLYILNLQGVNMMKSIQKDKLTHNDTNVQRVYNELECIVNENRVSSDLYTNLLNTLDAVMFEECGELDTFYVKDDEYTLESLYYKQGSWVCELEWEEQQIFNFSNSKGFDEGECMYLLMYVVKYINLLTSIENQYNNIKLITCVDKLKDRLRNVYYVVQNLLETYLGEDNMLIKDKL